MAKNEISELERKKTELETELNHLYHELDDSIDRVRYDVNTQLDPKILIRNYPLVSVGASLLVGYLIGHKRPKGKKKPKGDSVADTVIDGLKGIAAKKAITMAVNFIEKRFSK